MEEPVQPISPPLFTPPSPPMAQPPLQPEPKKSSSGFLLAVVFLLLFSGLAFAGIKLWQAGVFSKKTTKTVEEFLPTPVESVPTKIPTINPLTITPTESPVTQTKGGLTKGTPVKIKSITLTTSTGPLVIKGTVDSGWMFEGTMPVLLLDSSRNEIASGSAAEVTPGSWQSGKAVDFSVSLAFTTKDTSGFLVFKNDNPSGFPENQKTFELPIKFVQN